ncbi:MAG: TlpA family protein disulfide reductase [Actinobacteria bacterium]|nr:TlpA family protein disulfide reductase [Actinomycetota bacterium]
MKNIRKVLYGVAFVLLASGILFTFFHDRSKGVLFAAEKAPNFTLTSINGTNKGKPVSISMYKGKVVLLNFWATWCPPCRFELPDLAKVYDKFKSKGLVIIGVTVSSTTSVAKKMIKEDKIKYPVVMDDGSVANLYGGINAVPTTFLIDKNGNIVNRQVGMFFDKRAIESFVKSYLNKKHS